MLVEKTQRHKYCDFIFMPFITTDSNSTITTETVTAVFSKPWNSMKSEVEKYRVSW